MGTEVVAATSAPPSAAEQPSTASRVFGAIAIAGVGLFGAVSLWFVVRGRVNADEGWYLYAGRLAWQGQLPFHDFSFTQMPLVPYVYGPFQLLVPSLYVGRIVSLLFATAAVGLGVRVAWREAGRAAAAAVALLCLAFPIGIYNLTITKTYALVAFLLVAILAALTSPTRKTLMFPLAAAAATGLALARTSGIPLALLVVAYVVWRAPDRATRWKSLVVPTIAAVLTGALLLSDVDAARFGLSTFHSLLWHHASTSTRIDTIFTDRIPDWFGLYWGYLIVVGVALAAVVASSEVRRYVRERPVYPIMAVGIVLYLASQLPAGQWQGAAIEYVVPVVPVVLTMTIVLVFRWCFGPNGTRPAFRFAPIAVGAAVVALATLTVFHPSARGFLVDSGSAGSVAAANRVADVVKERAGPDGEVLALWAQPATVSSDRDLVDDVTFGIFSYQDLSTERARDLHYVNQQRLVEILDARRPAVVVLSELDRVLFNFRGSLSRRRTDPDTIPAALDRNYRKVYSDSIWGTNSPTPVDVYVRK